MIRKINEIKDLKFFIRIFVILLSTASPAILMNTQGILDSISSYWNTPMQPFIILINVACSVLLYKIRIWRAPSFFLFMLTAFSIESYYNVHNIMGILFLATSFYSLFISNKFKYCMWFFIGSLIIMPFSLLTGEIIAIVSLCLYHLLLVNQVYKFKNGL